MSTAVASATPVTLPPLDHNPSPRNYPTLAPSTSFERQQDTAIHSETPYSNGSERTPPEGKRSPRGLRNTSNPKIIVKKEPPTSPSLQGNARHRPKRLDLNTTSNTPASLTSRPSAGPGTGGDGRLMMQDVGFACLSPGFQTQDPTMREQLQRSMSVRDQQRSIIEQRLLKSAKGDGSEMSNQMANQMANPPDTSNPFGKGPLQSSKKRPPPGLSIVPPPAEHFANERIVQSAPLNQTFTGRNVSNPGPRQVVNQPSNLSQSSHIHQVPAVQTNNRLPPISDVFGQETLNPSANRPPFLHTTSTPGNALGPPMPSPGFPPQTAHPMSQMPQPQFERPREYRSAEEAVHELTGGREELLPKIVHYGGHQPPTPPSPHPRSHEGITPNHQQPSSNGSMQTGRRRNRNEYEADSSPPLGSGRDRPRYSGPFGEGRDSPATQRAKKEEFLQLCARAWDLFHS